MTFNSGWALFSSVLVFHLFCGQVAAQRPWHPACQANADTTTTEADGPVRTVAKPSEELRARLKLDPFYTKHVSAGGFPIVSSNHVSDVALREAAYLIDQMLAKRDDIRHELIESRTHFVVMAPHEFTTDIPEHRDLRPKDYWDWRARGLGATPQRPAVSCGEENLFGLPGDPYRAEDILIHEFAHAMHHMGLNSIDPQFDVRLKAIFHQATEEKLWQGKYVGGNRAEYWAEGVQSFFGTNRPPNHDHNHVDTRDELRDYDPRLFALIDDVFRGNTWTTCFVAIRPAIKTDPATPPAQSRS